jgi:hypothetical protein
LDSGFNKIIPDPSPQLIFHIKCAEDRIAQIVNAAKRPKNFTLELTTPEDLLDVSKRCKFKCFAHCTKELLEVRSHRNEKM